MGKLKKVISRIPLMPSLIIVMSFFIILAVILSKTTTSYANEQIQLIGAKYTVFEEKTDVGEHSAVHYYNIDVLPFSEEDEQAHNFYKIIYEYSSFFWCIVSITIGAVIFYFGKLKKPIKLLINASENISDDNLDFVIDYSGKDELGQLCSSFEKMRLSLMDNNRTMWRMVEEKRKLNKAFSHELRTPLTVMRGNVELLEKVLVLVLRGGRVRFVLHLEHDGDVFRAVLRKVAEYEITLRAFHDLVVFLERCLRQGEGSRQAREAPHCDPRTEAVECRRRKSVRPDRNGRKRHHPELLRYA